MSDERCFICRYWWENPERNPDPLAARECRRHALPYGAELGLFHCTKSEEWCGDFEPHKEK